MGNCLVLQEEKVIKIMRMDGKILTYQSPMKVHQALSEFPGHAISDALPVVRFLDPTVDMRSGHLYYLLGPKKAPVAESGVVRIKLVISKQELKEMLKKEGVSLDDLVSHLQRDASNSGESEERSMGWMPALESIPEGNDLY